MILEDFAVIESGGSEPYVFGDLAPATYIVLLRDQDLCESRDTIEVIEPAELVLEKVATTQQICPEDSLGTATLIVSGGTGPYTYQIYNDSLPDPVDSLETFDSLLVDTNFLDNLQPSPFYFAVINDANDCGPDTLAFEILPPPQPQVVNALIDQISCPGNTDGQLSAIVSPPPGDSITITDYAWFRLNEDNSKGEQVAVGRTTEPNLTVGAYLLEVTLSNDCVWPFPGFVDSPGLVSLDSVAIDDPTCLGDTDGSIELFAVGGTPNPDGSYNYSWSDLDSPITVATRTGLSAGTYSVTISDANNCQPAFETSFEVEDPDGIVGEFTVVENVSCPSDTTADGRITFAPRFTNDSIGTFDFFWSTGDTIRGETSSSLSGLARGPISVTVTDGVCPQVFDTIIGSPDEFAFEPIITDATCNGDTTGAAEITVTGGTPGYTFSYVDRPETTNRLEDVGAGLYQLLVTDANGCQADTFSFVINQPDSLILAIDPFVTTPRVTCFGDEDGVLAVQVVSTNNNPLGDSPYNWSPAVASSNEQTATDLAPGTYGVTVTDEVGCQDSLSYTIFEPDPITFTVDTIADPLCFNDPAEITLDTAFGGQGTDLLDYSFTINNDGFLTPFDQVGLGFGDSVVIAVFDSVGCSSEQTFQIQQPDEIVIDLPNRLLVELGDSSTQLNPLISPGGRDYRYRWTAPRFEPPAPFLSNDSIRDPFLVVPTQSVEYTLTVTDENGCQAIDDIFVEIDANRNIFIPNVFSPNMDGRNDDFRIYACTGVVGITKVNIFNRWGGLLFERENIPSSCLDGTLLWDGRTPEGREVDPGVYVYTVEVLFIDGVTLLYRGDIAVVR
ncbi:gliding motility-associated C-terminal domain-containing protein [Neolewinella sp.]|uniref:T9SS type B sorting domain-containing protein n=1 Tax=Neolewinella sp. TaxID=2993543 RepID=UPI003B51D4FF